MKKTIQIDLLKILKNREECNIKIDYGGETPLAITSFHKNGVFHIEIEGAEPSYSLDGKLYQLAEYVLFDKPAPAIIKYQYGCKIRIFTNSLKIETVHASVTVMIGDAYIFVKSTWHGWESLIAIIKALLRESGDTVTPVSLLDICNSLDDEIEREAFYLTLTHMKRFYEIIPIALKRRGDVQKVLLVEKLQNGFYKIPRDILNHLITVEELYEKAKSEYAREMENNRRKASREIKTIRRKERGAKLLEQIKKNDFVVIGGEVIFNPHSWWSDFIVMTDDGFPMVITTRAGKEEFFITRVEEWGIEKALDKFNVRTSVIEDVKVIKDWISSLNREARKKALELLNEKVRNEILEDLVEEAL